MNFEFKSYKKVEKQDVVAIKNKLAELQCEIDQKMDARISGKLSALLLDIQVMITNYWDICNQGTENQKILTKKYNL